MPPTQSSDPYSDPYRLRPVLTADQIRALTLARELNMWNTIRRNRAALMKTVTFDQSSPAFQCAFLAGLGQIDQHRRSLRELLREALDKVPA